VSATRKRIPARSCRDQELENLRVSLAEANQALRAIRGGEVDAVVVAGKQGPQVFTLQGAEHAYRVLIESMNEGALTLTSDKMILYSNQCFARMIKGPLEKVIGGSFRRYLSTADRKSLRQVLKRGDAAGAKLYVKLIVGDGSQLPVQISIRPLDKTGTNRATVGMVVTDMTEARRTEEMLRALTHRVVQVQEVERGRVAFELHDNITQLICAVLFRSQALADKLSPHDGTSKNEAIKLRELLSETAAEVERISHNLGPNVLEHLGLVAAMNDVGAEFETRTGVKVKLVYSHFSQRLSAEVELAFFRILQEALRNIEKHAAARRVCVRLSRQGVLARLTINDDGIGFPTGLADARKPGKGGLGLLSMHERAACVGGTFSLRSIEHLGTEIEVLVPAAARSVEAN